MVVDAIAAGMRQVKTAGTLLLPFLVVGPAGEEENKENEPKKRYRKGT